MLADQYLLAATEAWEQGECRYRVLRGVPGATDWGTSDRLIAPGTPPTVGTTASGSVLPGVSECGL